MSKSYNSSAEQNLRLCLKKYRVNKYIFKNGFSFWMQNILDDFDVRYVLWILILLRLTLLDWKPLNFQKLCKMCLEHQQLSAVHVTTVRMTRRQYREKWLEIQKNTVIILYRKYFCEHLYIQRLGTGGQRFIFSWIIILAITNNDMFPTTFDVNWQYCTLVLKSKILIQPFFFYIQALFCFVLLWYL